MTNNQTANSWSSSSRSWGRPAAATAAAAAAATTVYEGQNSSARHKLVDPRKEGRRRSSSTAKLRRTCENCDARFFIADDAVEQLYCSLDCHTNATLLSKLHVTNSDTNGRTNDERTNGTLTQSLADMLLLSDSPADARFERRSAERHARYARIMRENNITMSADSDTAPEKEDGAMNTKTAEGNSDKSENGTASTSAAAPPRHQKGSSEPQRIFRGNRPSLPRDQAQLAADRF